MRRLPPYCTALIIVLFLGAMVGCQGFSAGKGASQSAQPDPPPCALTAAPTSVTFGNVQIGTSQTQTETLTNTGGSSLTLTQDTVSGAGFSVTGLSLPLTLAAGQSVTVSVVFTPQSTGSASGTLALTDDGATATLNINLSGTGVAAGSLTATPTSLTFGNVLIGTGQTQTETLKNSGGENITISQVTSSAAGFTVTGLSLPATLVPNQSTTFGVLFAPSTAGASNGTLSMTVSGSSTTMDVALSGTGFTPATLNPTPASLSFNGVNVGSTQTQTVTVQNTGGASATISQDSISGTGFSVSGINTPFTLSPGQSATLSVVFAPKSSGTVNGSLTLSSNASNTNLTVSLSGTATGAAQGQLSVSPAIIEVGNVTVGTSGTQTGTLSATGASVVVSSVSVGGGEFSVSGLAFPVTIAAGQSANFTVTFSPQGSGLASANLSFLSNAADSSAAATVTGTGVAAPVHTVSLSWVASSSPDIIGYNVYRRTGTTGSYTKINATLDSAVTFQDSSVMDGLTYYYETTSVNSSNEESAASSPVAVTIPGP